MGNAVHKALLSGLIVAMLLGLWPLQGTFAALPSGPYLNPNQKATIGVWEIQVSNVIKWSKELKGDIPSQAKDNMSAAAQPKVRRAQAEMSFALVPVTIKNTSDRTASLLVGVWNLYDSAGRVYLMLTLGLDIMPASDYLNMKDFKPGETRKGFLPFEIPDSIDKNNKYVQLVVPLIGSATWKL